MITEIGDILKEIIPNSEELEIIYTQHYIHPIGYDEKHHLLMIRHCPFSYETSYFDLDTVNVTNVLEAKLPLEVDYDSKIMIDNGVTYKFYITTLK